MSLYIVNYNKTFSKKNISFLQILRDYFKFINVGIIKNIHAFNFNTNFNKHMTSH